MRVIVSAARARRAARCGGTAARVGADTVDEPIVVVDVVVASEDEEEETEEEEATAMAESDEGGSLSSEGDALTVADDAAAPAPVEAPVEAPVAVLPPVVRSASTLSHAMPCRNACCDSAYRYRRIASASFHVLACRSGSRRTRKSRHSVHRLRRAVSQCQSHHRHGDGPEDEEEEDEDAGTLLPSDAFVLAPRFA